MFQRLASLYLLLAALCLLSLYFFPILQIQIVDEIYDLDLNGLEYSENGKASNLIHFPFFMVVPLLALFSLACIFLYKKHQVQLRLGRLNYLMVIFLIIMMIYSSRQAISQMENGDVSHISYQGFYFPVAAIAFIFLANRAIKREVELIKIFEKISKNKY